MIAIVTCVGLWLMEGEKERRFGLSKRSLEFERRIVRKKVEEFSFAFCEKAMVAAMMNRLDHRMVDPFEAPVLDNFDTQLLKASQAMRSTPSLILFPMEGPLSTILAHQFHPREYCHYSSLAIHAQIMILPVSCSRISFSSPLSSTRTSSSSFVFSYVKAALLLLMRAWKCRIRIFVSVSKKHCVFWCTLIGAMMASWFSTSRVMVTLYSPSAGVITPSIRIRLTIREALLLSTVTAFVGAIGLTCRFGV